MQWGEWATTVLASPKIREIAKSTLNVVLMILTPTRARNSWRAAPITPRERSVSNGYEKTGRRLQDVQRLEEAYRLAGMPE
jgi:hypothetical protein